ncbi:phage tail protein [Gilliamella sp. B2717]|uniref:phage tail protein n=1 Tax=Gilliamella sp. B2717 TaxID=2817996 RepID=UPI00226A53D1|nr:phage tail protein [Gilliamella sp. B2717]MCX8578807.1 phage tail protein [Gilliamella sp. B2717]
MMMCYGLFVFELKTVPFQSIEENKDWRFPANSRVNQRSALQFIGRDNETMTLSGILYPELTGGRLSLAILERMADLGASWPLIDGTGIPLGFYVMTNLKKTKTEFFRDGTPRKIEFIISLTKTDPPGWVPYADIIGMI